MKHKEIANISKSAWQVVEQAKTVTGQNVVDACTKGTLKIERNELTKLLVLIGASIDQGYSQIISSFENEVQASLTRAVSDVSKPSKK